jgi:hypothetical protein
MISTSKSRTTTHAMGRAISLAVLSFVTGTVTAPATEAQRFRVAAPNDYAGQWRMTSDDETSGEVVELEVSGNSIRGMLTAISRGYFSGRTSVESQFSISGTFRGGGFDIQLQDARGGPVRAASLRLRGEYLIVLVDGNEASGYARPGRSLTESAEGSPEAPGLARRIMGRVFATSRQASGRGAFVGSRRKVSFCADGSMTYESSDLASTPGSLPDAGVDMGSTVSRRGRWSIVLYTGIPVVRADWNGTGTSYSLVAYFRVTPAADGRSANVDGEDLPLGGTC